MRELIYAHDPAVFRLDLTISRVPRPPLLLRCERTPNTRKGKERIYANFHDINRLDRTPHEVFWGYRFLTAKVMNLHGSTMPFIETGNRICSHDIYTTNAQEDEKYDYMSVMTTTSRKTSLPHDALSTSRPSFWPLSGSIRVRRGD